uniref:Solute carrier family 12 member 9 n=1 Tax=Photinus pyralis TaxID=7054 RepID=A0A1Y1KDM3_PHOPY
MVAPEIGSTNADITTDKTPLVNRSVLQRLYNFFGRSAQLSTNITSDGYVEFGSITEGLDNRTLGTFSGVFAPVTLSMFSALIFLRVGYLVGNAGLLVTLLQFFISYVILIFTVASICAISTNGAVEGGGAYFMISRTLGPEFGGSIGTLFFLANIVNSAFNISGCVEGLVQLIGPGGYLVHDDGWVPDGLWFRFLYSSILNCLNLIICLIGAGMFAKTTVFILATVIVCTIISFISFFVQAPMQVPIPNVNTLVHNSTGFFTGLNSSTMYANLKEHYGHDYTVNGEEVTFASVFAVLFSGVTGIMAGANMSGMCV